LSVCERIRVFVKLVRIVDDVPMFAHFVGKVRSGVGVADDVFHDYLTNTSKYAKAQTVSAAAIVMAAKMSFMLRVLS
jgi:hypothetical protein